MKPSPNRELERCRVRSGPLASDATAGNNGLFRVVSSLGTVLAVIVSDGGGWDHASVSLPDRCPDWDEMCEVRDLVFLPDEWTMQLHPPKAENISCHPYCLHIWRPQAAEIPTPPTWMIGPQ